MGICGFKGARTVTLSQPEDSDSESKPAGGDRVLSSGGDDAIKKSVGKYQVQRI